MSATDGQGAAGGDPGLLGEEPSDEALAEEEHARSDASIHQMVQWDLDDDATPSRRAADGQPVPGSFDVPLRPYRGGPTDAG